MPDYQDRLGSSRTVCLEDTHRRVGVRGGRTLLSVALGLSMYGGLAHADPATALETTADTIASRAGLARDDARAAARAIEAHLGAPFELLAATAVGSPLGDGALVVATHHARFDACVLAEPHATRAEFHEAREACSDASGIETRIVRVRFTRGDDSASVGDRALAASCSSTTLAPIEEEADTITVIALGSLDFDGDGRPEPWAHVVESRTETQYQELDEETRGEPEGLEVTRYTASLRVVGADFEVASQKVLPGDGSHDAAYASFVPSVVRARHLDLLYACEARARTAGCHRGARHVRLVLGAGPSADRAQ